jgi:hypothetical protein
MLKVFIEPPEKLSRAMKRVALTMAEHCPSDVRLVRRTHEADLVVLHVIGSTGLVQAIEKLQMQGRRYAIIQYCLRTTEWPTCASWLPLWKDAAFVWSYYDLPSLAREDGWQFEGNFIFEPLGVNSDVFKRSRRPKNRRYRVGTSGYVAESESVGEVVRAAAALNRDVFHLGPNLFYADNVHSKNGIDDYELVSYYQDCDYVSGLRRGEGFELPAAEGLLCGARPILFDRPHYRQWYSGFGVFVTEAEPEALEKELIEVLRSDPRPISDLEWAAAEHLFSWTRIVPSVWSQALEVA